MISKKDIVQMAKHIMRRGEYIPDRKIMHPSRDWFIGVSVAALAFVLSGLFAWQMFSEQSERASRSLSVDERIEIYKQEEAQDVLELYGERTRVFNTLRGEQADVVFTLPEVDESEEGGGGQAIDLAD